MKIFSEIYNDLIIDTLSTARSARISNDSYLPIINDGEYKEASSRVPIRLMYYIALLKMSLTNNNVTFPRFLVIDTPETAGIELEYLKKCLEQLNNIENLGIDYQVILTTGLNKYPKSFLKNQAIFMLNKEKSLLKLNKSKK